MSLVNWYLNAGNCNGYKKAGSRTSLVVQWLGFWDPNAGGPGWPPGQGTRSHMPQPRPSTGKFFFLIHKFFKKEGKFQREQCSTPSYLPFTKTPTKVRSLFIRYLDPVFTATFG